MKSFELLNGDCLQLLKWIESDSIDAIVTDPPYGLAFMGKKWDYDVPSVEIWKECLRVLKPGGHLLSFGGTRTYHRMVVNIEDAGFEIRDQIQWLYGSGFPKSTDVSKRIDKEAGAERDILRTLPAGSGPLKRGHVGTTGGGMSVGTERSPELTVTAPATDAAKQWKGWGTALKPANEPICLARKPLEKGLTVAQNVLKWGCGAINIVECRIGLKPGETTRGSGKSQSSNPNTGFGDMGEKRIGVPNIKSTEGRWPANIILDEAAAEMLDEQSGNIRSRNGYGTKGQTGGGTGNAYVMRSSSVEVSQKVVREDQNGYLGGTSRFFYVAKASKAERNKGLEGMPKVTARSGMGGAMPIDDDDGNARDRFTVTSQNHHPTVKPIKLMEYLIKLVTPPSGIVLDPFMGSGSTGVASQNLKLEFLGIERDKQYFEIANKRINKKEINK